MSITVIAMNSGDIIVGSIQAETSEYIDIKDPCVVDIDSVNETITTGTMFDPLVQVPGMVFRMLTSNVLGTTKASEFVMQAYSNWINS